MYAMYIAFWQRGRDLHPEGQGLTQRKRGHLTLACAINVNLGFQFHE